MTGKVYEMKVSTRVEFGIIALADIAIYSENGGTVSSADIAARQNISQKYLEQIITALRQGGFVKGQKGSRGGYYLSRPADKIYLSDILNALDNNILADVYETYDIQEDGVLRSSVNICLWDKMNSYLRRFTEQMTLADLIDECRMYSDRKSSFMYNI